MMRFGKCKYCKKWRFLTKHSRIGGHQPPFDYICQGCHDEKHGIKPNKEKRYLRKHRKYQPGTPKHRRKKK